MEPASGQGDGQVQFVAAENPVPAAREGEIVVNDDRVRVMQEPAACRFTIDPARQTVAADGGTGSFTVATHEACRWAARSTAEWITITTGIDGAGNGTVTYGVTGNSSDPRSGTVMVGDTTHTVVQQGGAAAPTPPTPPPPPPPSCTYTINRTGVMIGAGGGTTPVSVTTTATCSWTAVSNDAWLSVTSGAAGTGNGTVSVTVAANPGGVRTGTLTIAGRTFTVSQPAPAPEPLQAGHQPVGRLSAPSGWHELDPRVCADRTSIDAEQQCVMDLVDVAVERPPEWQDRFVALPTVGAGRPSTIAIARHSFTVLQGVLPSQ